MFNIFLSCQTQECFNSPYGTSYFAEYAEKIPGESTEVLAKAAKENSIYLVGGISLELIDVNEVV